MGRYTRFSTNSGVLPVPFYTKPTSCGGICIFCPREPGLPHSYVGNEDTLAAKQSAFSPAAQLKRYSVRPDWPCGTGMPIEGIILGGSFSNLPRDYREQFVTELHTAISGNAGSLDDPTGWYDGLLRCSVLTVESRPDQISQEECEQLHKLGVTKVELGVQHLRDDVLSKNKRGHTADQVAYATRLLKDNGFKVGYHLMIGLPYASFEDDMQMCVQEVWRPRFNPDYLKVYPCELLKDKRLQPLLHRFYEDGEWQPIGELASLEILNALFQVVPHHVRLSRIQRQFDRGSIVSGIKRAMRPRVVDRKRDVRAREVGRSIPGATLRELSTPKYRISVIGQEYYLFVECAPDSLLGIARLTLKGEKLAIRELRVFGEASPIGEVGNIQGSGVGRSLLGEIEKLARRLGVNFVEANVGFGARTFFAKCLYELNAHGLMEKKVSNTEREIYEPTSMILRE